MKRHPTGAFDSGFRIGDQVCIADDPGHVGRVDAIISGTVKIVWNDNGWIQYEPNANNLVLVERVKEMAVSAEPAKVIATEGVAPKRKLKG